MPPVLASIYPSIILTWGFERANKRGNVSSPADFPKAVQGAIRFILTGVLAALPAYGYLARRPAIVSGYFGAC